MTLGESIQQLRRQQNLSQEDVGAVLGVSRQAVSKWENDQTLPDTGNLLAMAELFHVSADELAGKKQEAAVPSGRAASDGIADPENPSADGTDRESTAVDGIFKTRAPLFYFLFPIGIAAATLVCLALFFVLTSRPPAQEPAALPPSTPPPSVSASSSPSGPQEESASEFSLFWFDGGVQKHLAMGLQESSWDFGQDIATYSVSDSRKTDWPGATVRDYLCSAPETAPPTFSTFSVTVMTVDAPEDPPVRDSIIHLETTAEPFTTPRGIHPGSSEGELLQAYGDALLFAFKQSGSDLLCPHEYFYIYNEGGTRDLLFYISNYAVAGIELTDALDGEGLRVNNTTVFPMKDGAADFSQRVEPEKETVDETRAVFIALYTLTTDENLSAEDTYQCRRTIYGNLQFVDWQSYGTLGEAGVEIETQQVLLSWLQAQEVLSPDELLGLQLGCRSNLDGWLSEDYSTALAAAFFREPLLFAQLLASEESDLETGKRIVGSTAYGADAYPEQKSAAVAAIRESNLSTLTEMEHLWAEYLIAYLEAPLEEGSFLPLPAGLA